MRASTFYKPLLCVFFLYFAAAKPSSYIDLSKLENQTSHNCYCSFSLGKNSTIDAQKLITASIVDPFGNQQNYTVTGGCNCQGFLSDHENENHPFCDIRMSYGFGEPFQAISENEERDAESLGIDGRNFLMTSPLPEIIQTYGDLVVAVDIQPKSPRKPYRFKLIRISANLLHSEYKNTPQNTIPGGSEQRPKIKSEYQSYNSCSEDNGNCNDVRYTNNNKLPKDGNFAIKKRSSLDKADDNPSSNSEQIQHQNKTLEIYLHATSNSNGNKGILSSIHEIYLGNQESVGYTSTKHPAKTVTLIDTDCEDKSEFENYSTEFSRNTYAEDFNRKTGNTDNSPQSPTCTFVNTINISENENWNYLDHTLGSSKNVDLPKTRIKRNSNCYDAAEVNLEAIKDMLTQSELDSVDQSSYQNVLYHLRELLKGENSKNISEMDYPSIKDEHIKSRIGFPSSEGESVIDRIGYPSTEKNVDKGDPNIDILLSDFTDSKNQEKNIGQHPGSENPDTGTESEDNKATSASDETCSIGQLDCDIDFMNKYKHCLFGKWITRDNPPGTRCVSAHGLIYFDFK